MIVALGETVVAIGVGISLKPISLPIIAASVLGIAALASIWWTYFEVAALMAEHSLHRLTDEQRPRLVRDSYTILHYPVWWHMRRSVTRHCAIASVMRKSLSIGRTVVVRREPGIVACDAKRRPV